MRLKAEQWKMGRPRWFAEWAYCSGCCRSARQGKLKLTGNIRPLELPIGEYVAARCPG